MTFHRIDNLLYVEDVPLSTLAASVGTPTYVYSWGAIAGRYSALKSALANVPHQIHYAVKANSNLALLHRLGSLGAGFDIVSGGELERVVRAGGNPDSVIFSGVGKSREEIAFALKIGVGTFNIESKSEYDRLQHTCKQLGLTANISFRVNPNVAVETHPYITTGLHKNKFGMPESQVLALAKDARQRKEFNIQGLACHIGSQITTIEPYEIAALALLRMTRELTQMGVVVQQLNLGGGFGIQYQDEESFSFAAFGKMIERIFANENIEIAVEPGRSLVGAAGVLLTHVEYLKPAAVDDHSNFAIVNAAMNDLIRPALYQAYHRIEPVCPVDGEPSPWNVVGPICETGDFLGLDQSLAIEEGMLLAVRNAGAYGFSLASNYNSRRRCPEVLVDGSSFHVVRERETMHDQLRLEHIH